MDEVHPHIFAQSVTKAQRLNLRCYLPGTYAFVLCQPDGTASWRARGARRPACFRSALAERGLGKLSGKIKHCIAVRILPALGPSVELHNQACL